MSPARAASMVAFSANRLVCSAMSWISVTTSPILRTEPARLSIFWLLSFTSASARPTMSVALET